MKDQNFNKSEISSKFHLFILPNSCYKFREEFWGTIKM